MKTVDNIRTLIVGLLLMCSSGHIAIAKPSDSFRLREFNLPTTGTSQQHNLSKTTDGHLIVSWVETDGQNSTVKFATLEGEKFSIVHEVIQVEGKLAAAPVVLSLSDGTLVVAWMPYPQRKGENRYLTDIYLARSIDGGLSWSPPLKPYGDAAHIYDAQMSLTALPDRRLALVWTDMRHVSPDSTADKKYNRHQLMATVIDKDWLPSPEITLDADVCSCCSSYTATLADTLVTVYRDHLPGEIRDISAVRWTPFGNIQSTLVNSDGWVINGCPSNGPSVDMSPTHTVAAWFSAADGKGRVKVAFSEDSAAHFESPIELDNNASGYANALLLDDGSALAGWRGRAGPQDELKIGKVSKSGKLSRQTTVYRGGFPKWPSKHLAMTRIGQQAFMAWTDPQQKRVRLVLVRLD
ncbi:MAG: exo-alpha-sialidase [Methylomonas sp.]|jgi:hypothetical protein|uniref:exo-alpha-sialidase n=1 Tax=Methylomonas sp. TaxID=418 RepID=UPI0025E98A12|nr:exo-alpha-sialidase [Methylomonas sp.]MCK9608485.1 exo-alpha-sialidase [Methylomonas sp.]